ncbi:MAG: TetR/AcrR family transcriptional regulator [Myxococcota bacterium]
MAGRRSAVAEQDVADEGRRGRILSAALQTFAERGFDGATTREIAERAGANHGLIRYYFSSKEELWKAAVDRCFEELTGELGDAAANQDVAAAETERLVRRFVHFTSRNPEFIRLMNDEGKRNGARMRWLVKRHVRPIYEALVPRLEELGKQRGGPPIPPLSLYYIMVGAAGLIFSQAPEAKAASGEDPTTEAAVEAHADAVVSLLLGRR